MEPSEHIQDLLETVPQKVTNEDDWNFIVWAHMDEQPREYPNPEEDFDRAENDLLDTLSCDCKQVEHLRNIGVI